MSRLTKDLRERMAQSVLNNAFKAKEVAAREVVMAISDKIHSDIYSEHLAVMNSLPNEFLTSVWHLYIAIAGQEHLLSFSACKRKAYSHDRYNKAKHYVGDEPIALEYLKAVDVVEDIKKQRNSMKHEVEAILNSVQTFKKLWTVWPASKSILEKFETKPVVALLPAIQFDKVNAALGLPMEVA